MWLTNVSDDGLKQHKLYATQTLYKNNNIIHGILGIHSIQTWAQRGVVVLRHTIWIYLTAATTALWLPKEQRASISQSKSRIHIRNIQCYQFCRLSNTSAIETHIPYFMKNTYLWGVYYELYYFTKNLSLKWGLTTQKRHPQIQTANPSHIFCDKNSLFPFVSFK